jgi:hypothetical protein
MAGTPGRTCQAESARTDLDRMLTAARALSYQGLSRADT